MTLTATGLTYVYGRTRSGDPARVRAEDEARDAGGDAGGVRGLTHAFRPNAVTAVLGPNGAGKSTLLRLLSGLRDPPEASMVTLDHPCEADAQTGDQIDTQTSGVVAVAAVPGPARAARLAYLPQRPGVAPGFTAAQIAGFGRPDARGARATRAANDALARAGLPGLGGRPIETLSAGQQQLVSVARVLVQLGLTRDPPASASGSTSGVSGGTGGHGTPGGSRWLLADEPTSALDPRHAAAVFRLLRSVASDPWAPAGVVVVVHDPTLARTHADEALVLDARGRLHSAGPVATTVTPDVLGAVFGVPYRAFDAGRVLVPAG